MASLFGAFAFLVTLYADGGYQGPEFQSAMKRNLRQTIRSSQGLPRPAQAMDRRTHPRLAWPLPETGERLGMPQSQGARLPASRLPASRLRQCCESYAIPHNVPGQTLTLQPFANRSFRMTKVNSELRADSTRAL